MRKEFLITGFGGQGIQSLGKTLARALDNNGFLVSFKSNYGAHARGGKSFSEVIIKDSPEDWPQLLYIDVLVAMSQEGYDAFLSQLSDESVVIYNENLVRPSSLCHARHYPVPVIKIASELGKEILANIVMLGAIVAVTELCSFDDVASILQENKPALSASDELFKALAEGFRAGNSVRNKSLSGILPH